MPYYLYCSRNGIQPFIDLNEKRGMKEKYKDDFTIGKDGVPFCKAGRKMNHDGSDLNIPENEDSIVNKLNEERKKELV